MKMLKKTSNHGIPSLLLTLIYELTFPAQRNQGLLKHMGFRKGGLGSEFVSLACAN